MSAVGVLGAIITALHFMTGSQKFDQGMPSLFQLAVMLPAFKDEIRPTSPPWLLLKTTATLIAPLAKLRGYRATHPYPRDPTTTSAVVAS